MKSALSFLIAARRCEVGELERLACTSALVEAIGRLVHALQRERGLSNGYLASGGARFGPQREAQVDECLRLEQAVRLGFDRLEDEASVRACQDGTRLFSRVAWVLPGLLALPALRRRIAARQLDAEAATAAFAKLIGGLLAVVFEAADGAADPQISRLLGALFQLMQGKEFAGQERACGAAAFAAGTAGQARQQRWLALIAAQERCFESFAGFADAAQAEDWRTAQPLAELAEIERLRRIACASPAGTPLDSELSAHWFDACSRRLDAMKAVEDRLAAELRRQCESRIADARAEAQAHAALLSRLEADGEPAPEAFFDAAPPDLPDDAPALGRHLERSVLDMLQAQSQRLQTVSDELDALRAALNERKLVERAKGLLMARRRLTEQEAHQMLRQTAMNQNRRLVDVAESVLSMADYLPE
ncbi:nitrate- and nitrite sensing domain-containing protein [Ottowia sp.]|uniref:nitrate- and nitrite sensing domain-containing protein n=1 Tax=Ottowia sp. TaxID=1898956 RepID=UPI0039E4E6CA